MRSFVLLLAAWITGLAWPGVACAEDDAGARPYKFTAGLYQLSGGGVPGGQGLDINLRNTSGVGALWIGWLGSTVQDVSQPRGGWDRSFDIGPVRLMPSLQVASGGFWGGGVGTGSSWFAGVGLGRANLRPYASPDFDPNDVYTLTGGYRWADSSSFSLQLVRDNRLSPDQQHVHLIYRTPIRGDERLTVDLLSKTGLVAGVPVQRLGLSLAYDWPSYFVRVAYDPKVNFTTQDMWRLSVGTRF